MHSAAVRWTPPARLMASRGSAIEIPTISKSVVNSSTGFLAPGQEACRRKRTSWASDGTGVASKSAFAKRELQVARRAGGIAVVDLAIAPPIEHSYGGNAGAMVQTLAVDPFNANIVYTGSFGGLAKTTDGGFTWQYLSDAWTSQSVSAIAVDPNASRIVYAGTGREDYGPYSVGLYRSFDGGLTWSRPLGDDHFAGTYVRTIAIDPNASGSELSTTLYVANTSGLWRSTDSGTTFSAKAPGRNLRCCHRCLHLPVYALRYR